MIVIYNNIIPFKGFKAINILGVIFVRKNAIMNDINFNHEKIHTRQIFELLFIGFYLWYIIEFIIKFIIYRNFITAYKNISFEKEAYNNENNYMYINTRKHYNFIKYFIS